MYEVFEHTADVGLRIRADSFEGLLVDAAHGLFSLICERIDDVRPDQAVSVRIDGEDPAYLLFDWLNELLYLFDTRRLLLSRFELAVDGTGIRATAFGEPWDPARHRLEHEVKAITYHGLEARPADGGWEGAVIVDI
ncbi:MAG: archease [Planctomycetota bacterium]|jgi:SHS2 domain-containing protein